MRLTVAEISLSNIAHNLNFLRGSAPGSDILAIVKANGYGHGMVRISQELSKLRVGMFGVAFADEGVVLREAGIEGKIIVLVPESNGNAKLCVDYDLTPVVYHEEFLEIYNREAALKGITADMHLFIDSGMNREGIRPSHAVDFMKYAAKLKNLTTSGICTHFAAPWSKPEFTALQLGRFNETLDNLKNNGFEFRYIHAANSAAAVKLPQSRFNVIRPGLALYGYPPTYTGDPDFPLKPLMTLKTKVCSVRRISEGDTVGYNLAYISDKDRNIATIPIGYGDGFFRNLTGSVECLIRGERYDLVGTICMDSSMIDTGDDEIQLGEEVVLIGKQGSSNITAYELAERLGTIPYEITSAISARVPRVYV